MAAGSNPRSRRPAWIDLSSPDPAASRAFYERLFGWRVDVSPDPQYGGYGIAHLPDGGEDVAGIGPKMMAEAPTTWNLYLGADDAGALGDAVAAAGGTVVMPAFDVGEMGRMAVFQDAVGAFISAWQPAATGSFRTGDDGTFGWAELNARGIDRARAFYGSVFGWTARTSPMGEGQPDYTEFQLDGESILGGLEMMPNIPPEVPSYWMVYFNVADVDAAFARAVEAGATEMVAPVDFPGGRFAIVGDPQGAMFGLLRTAQSSPA
jgi:predicted enzyme related to lactoylglutathione lyase